MDDGFAILAGKRVGLICNQTSMSGYGLHTRVALQRDPRVQLTALYAPEHGIDGKLRAGVKFASTRDSVTGLPVYSLYGDTRKPTPTMLSGIDVLLFDLQDIGSRSYTYISTMIRAQEACAEQGKAFVVLDRPNPLGGLRVEGPPLDMRWVSFVGQVPVPYVHGMTAGEIARMAQARGWISGRAQLTVVPTRGWRREMLWEDTGLRWYPTSPNIPYPSSPRYYVATGILGGAAGVDIGIGTDAPFQYAGGIGVDGHELARRMAGWNFSGVRMVPYRRNSFGGVRLEIAPRAAADLCALDIVLLAEINRMRGGAVLSGMSGDKLDIFHKVYGSDRLYRDLRRGVPAGTLIASWRPSVEAFRQDRQAFLMY